MANREWATVLVQIESAAKLGERRNNTHRRVASLDAVKKSASRSHAECPYRLHSMYRAGNVQLVLDGNFPPFTPRSIYRPLKTIALHHLASYILGENGPCRSA
jgi:hypothetical protein